MYVDSHCHLSLPELAGDLDAVVARMRAAGVGQCLNVCVKLSEYPAVLQIAQRYAGVYASVGVHPDNGIEQGADGPGGPTGPDGKDGPDRRLDVAALLERAADPLVVAIGETGLDYYRAQEPLDWQRERFRIHIRAARACGKPLVIHTRSAAADTLAIMAEEGAAQVGGVMHCFTETQAVASAALAMNFMISFSGIVTFKNAAALRAVAASVPLERLLIETDAPYLAPMPHRGKVNEPAWVVKVAEQIAALRGSSPEAIGAITAENFRALFRPPPHPLG